MLARIHHELGLAAEALERLVHLLGVEQRHVRPWLQLQVNISILRQLDAAQGTSLHVACQYYAARGATLVTVIAADHPGLFSRIAGAMALSGANIVAAQIFTTADGINFTETTLAADSTAEALRNGIRVTVDHVAVSKKRLIEEYCQGLVRFKDPKPGVTLDRVATHTAAKAKLRELAADLDLALALEEKPLCTNAQVAAALDVTRSAVWNSGRW